jgi:PAS domain S-box-containing protein
LQATSNKSYGGVAPRERDDVPVPKPRVTRKYAGSRSRISSSQHARQAHLASIIDSSDDAIISKSLDGTILSWNKSAQRLLGYSAREIVGCSIRLLIPSDRQDEETRILRSLQERDEPMEHFNTVRLTQDGIPLDVTVSISPIRDESGQVVGASKILREMTEQRRNELAIRDSEARLRRVVESASDVFITITELGAIESINQAGLLTFGYGREELIGQKAKTLMPDSCFTGGDGRLAGFLRTSEEKTTGIGREVTGRRKDGSTFPLDLAVSEVQLGNCKLFTCIARDITGRKEAERALVEAKENAEAASVSKELFLSVLSHELRTPLTPALAELSFIEESAQLPSEMRSRIQMVRRNIETEARLVDDLLDMTRITQGKVHLHLEAVDLHGTIRAALGMFQAAMDTKLLQVTLDLRAEQHHVRADSGRMQQILLNLLSNAVKFTPPGGRISIRSSNEQDGQIELVVCDSGAGIDPEMFPRLFNSFEQGDRTRRLGGLGLGLSIARSLTELHLGTLTASSEGVDRGSTFRLAMPTAVPAERVPSTPQLADLTETDQRILLVEDHHDTRTVLARLLKSLGCHVTAASSVREAIEAGEAATFDLLISDLGLPDGSGLEVMRRLKSRIGRGIALSGFGQQEDLRRSREAGFDLHLTKPVSFSTLKSMLQSMADKAEQ